MNIIATTDNGKILLIKKPPSGRIEIAMPLVLPLEPLKGKLSLNYNFSKTIASNWANIC
jgi:hypothetical protein